MKRLMPLVLLLLLSCVFAADAEEDALGTFVSNTTNDIEAVGNDFVEAGSAAGGGAAALGSTVLSAFKEDSCGEDWITREDLWRAMTLWLSPAVLMGFIVMLGVGILYILGQFFSSPNLVALAKDEAFQTGLTVLRVLFIAGMLVGAEIWFGISSAGSADDIYSKNPLMINAAMAFSRRMVADMSTHYTMLVLYNTVIHTIYSSTMWIGVTWRAMYSFNLGPVLKPLIDLVGTALQFLSLGMSEWLLHVITLCMIKKWMWTFFIPAGMLLRAFPYTRAGGEALLALAFALVIFYPLMFLVDYEAHKIMKENLVDAKNAMRSFIQKSGILGVFGTVLAVMLLSGGVFMPFFMGGALSLAFELIRGAVYYVIIMSLLLPFLNIFVTLTAAKETAKFFNVDVNFLSFLKII